MSILKVTPQEEINHHKMGLPGEDKCWWFNCQAQGETSCLWFSIACVRDDFEKTFAPIAK